MSDPWKKKDCLCAVGMTIKEQKVVHEGGQTDQNGGIIPIIHFNYCPHCGTERSQNDNT
jgi:hypothetical protein